MTSIKTTGYGVGKASEEDPVLSQDAMRELIGEFD